MVKFYITIICLMFFSCEPQQLSFGELTQFILNDENGLHRTMETNGMKVSVTFRPSDVLVRQVNGDNVIERTTLDSLRKKYSNHYYFVLSISRGDAEALHSTDMKTYSQLLETMAFRMPQYVRMTTSEFDVIPVADFVMNRTYGLSSSTDILFVFSREKVVGDSWVRFDVDELGLGIGNQRFTFLRKQLEQVPELSFNITN